MWWCVFKSMYIYVFLNKLIDRLKKKLLPFWPSFMSHRVVDSLILWISCLPVALLSCGLLPWKDWARFTVTPDSPLVVTMASDLWPSCILTSSLPTSESKGRRAGLGLTGFRDVGEESGMDGGEMEGGASFVLWWGTGLVRPVSPSGSPSLWVAPFCSRPAKHRVSQCRQFR